MKNFVVRSLEVLTGLIFFGIALFWAVAGYFSGLTLDPKDPQSGGLLGALVGLGMGILVAVFVTGVVYVLLSINEKLGSIRDELHSARSAMQLRSALEPRLDARVEPR